MVHEVLKIHVASIDLFFGEILQSILNRLLLEHLFAHQIQLVDISHPIKSVKGWFVNVKLMVLEDYSQVMRVLFCSTEAIKVIKLPRNGELNLFLLSKSFSSLPVGCHSNDVKCQVTLRYVFVLFLKDSLWGWMMERAISVLGRCGPFVFKRRLIWSFEFFYMGLPTCLPRKPH